MNPCGYRRIYVDFDDVVTETARGLADLLHELHGRLVRYEDIRFFDLRRSFRLDEASYREFMEDAHAPQRLALLEETPGACRTLRAWLHDGLDPVVVTGRPPWSHEATRHWLDVRGLGALPILHVDKYNRDPDREYPGVPVLRFGELHGEGFALAVDDAPPALELLAESGLCPFLVFDRPWNRKYVIPVGKGLRVRGWEDLDREVRRRLLSA